MLAENTHTSPYKRPKIRRDAHDQNWPYAHLRGESLSAIKFEDEMHQRRSAFSTEQGFGIAGFPLTGQPDAGKRGEFSNLSPLQQVLARDIDDLPYGRPNLRTPISVQLFRRIADRWAFSSQESAKLLGFENKPDLDLALSITVEISRDIQDRIKILFGIHEALVSLFHNNPITERAWLRRSQDRLHGASPKDIMLEGSMEMLLTMKQYMDEVSGR